jgi:hypothetical protein
LIEKDLLPKESEVLIEEEKYEIIHKNVVPEIDPDAKLMTNPFKPKKICDNEECKSLLNL